MILTVSGLVTSENGESWGCDAAGNIWVSSIELSMWSHTTALYPTIPVFRSKFSTVKAIDICWDFLPGRGYGGLCVFVVCNVFQTVMVDLMQTEFLPQEQIFAMELSPVSIASGMAYIRSFIQMRKSDGKKPKTSICWMTPLLIFAVAYTLAAPTWLSAMTSYQSVMRPLLPTEHGLLKFDQIKQECVYHIVDGSGIGLEDNVCIWRDSLWAGHIESCKKMLGMKGYATTC